MSERDALPPCPCCADRVARGALFKLTGPTAGVCEECLETVDGDELLASILSSASPVKLRFGLSIAETEALGEALMKRSRATLDGVAEVHSRGDPLAWDQVCAPLCATEAEWGVLETLCTFPRHVSTDKQLRDACTEVDTKMSKFAVEQSARKDIFVALTAYAATDEARALEGERARYLSRRLRDGRRLGLHLDDERAERIKELNTRCSELGIAFARNLGEDDTKFVMRGAQLAGMPLEWLKARKKGGEGGEGGEEDEFEVSLKYPDYVPLMERCSVDETRAKDYVLIGMGESYTAHRA